MNKETLEDYFQFVGTFVATNSEHKHNEKTFNKKELIEHLENILPDTHGYSLLFATKDEDKGI